MVPLTDGLGDVGESRSCCFGPLLALFDSCLLSKLSAGLCPAPGSSPCTGGPNILLCFRLSTIAASMHTTATVLTYKSLPVAAVRTTRFPNRDAPLPSHIEHGDDG